MAFFASSLDFDHTRRATAEAETVNEVVEKFAAVIGLIPHEPSGWAPGRGSFGGFILENWTENNKSELTTRRNAGILFTYRTTHARKTKMKNFLKNAVASLVGGLAVGCVAGGIASGTIALVPVGIVLFWVAGRVG